MNHFDRHTESSSFTGIFSRTAMLAFAVAATAWVLGQRFVQPELRDPDAVPRPVTPRGDLTLGEQTTIALFAAAVPSVVHVKTKRLERGAFLTGTIEVPEGAGTGFVWDDDGHIVTNYHVVEHAHEADVYLYGDEEPHPALLVGVDRDADLAVLKVDVSSAKLVPIPLGTSRDLRVGQAVLAIGNPFGLDHTLTSGVISGINRSIRSVSEMPIHGVIQTDAAINPGNSGGPLLDSAGRLIGVNTSIKSNTGTYVGVGFAVPVDLVNDRVPRILRDGFSVRAGLGITVGPDKWAEARGIRGAVVRRVFPESPAATAGLREIETDASGVGALGDVIVGIDDRVIEGRADLMSTLNSYGEGDVVRVTVSRDVDGRDERIEFPVTLAPLPR